MKEFLVTQADNGGFVITESKPNEPYKVPAIVAAVSSARDLIQVIAGMYGVEQATYQRSDTWGKSPDDDGWIEWNGGERPVGADTIVDYKNRREHGKDLAGRLRWNHYSNTAGGDIVAYRVVMSDGWIEWKGGEPPESQIVEVRFVDGTLSQDRPGMFYGWDRDNVHAKANPDKCSVAYRILKP